MRYLCRQIKLMRELVPQPKKGFISPQISALIRTFSCFFKPKITCKALIFLVLLSFASVAVSGSIFVGEHTVVSEYQSPVPGQSHRVVRWKFSEFLLGDNKRMVTVEDLDERVGCRAEFYYNEKRKLEQADCYRWIKGEEICDADQYDCLKPVLISSTIIPGDWPNRALPFNYKVNKRQVVLYEQVGSTRFANYIEIKDRKISLEEALAKGMIRTDLQSNIVKNSRGLCLVEVRSAKGKKEQNQKLLLEQLWEIGSDFWIYEAKPGRRSWLVLNR